MASENGYFVPNILQTDSSIYHEALGTTDAQVRVKEGNPSALRDCVHSS